MNRAVLVTRVHEALGTPEGVDDRERACPAGAFIDHPLRNLRHEGGLLLRPVRIGEVVDPHAGVVVGADDGRRTDEAALSVLVDVVRAEASAPGDVVGLVGDWERRDRDGQTPTGALRGVKRNKRLLLIPPAEFGGSWTVGTQ